MRSSIPPSAGRFRPGYAKHVLGPMLKFLKETRMPFMVNPYPYFAYNGKNVNFLLFRPNRGLYDRYTKLSYTNQFDALLDAVHSAMKDLGYGDVDIVVGETGWPSVCDGWDACSVANAQSFNGQLVKHLASGKGTPLMPNRTFESFVFALFNENQKPGPIAERNWGLFQPDFTPVYDCGIMRNGQVNFLSFYSAGPFSAVHYCSPLKPTVDYESFSANPTVETEVHPPPLLYQSEFVPHFLSHMATSLYYYHYFVTYKSNQRSQTH